MNSDMKPLVRSTQTLCAGALLLTWALSCFASWLPDEKPQGGLERLGKVLGIEIIADDPKFPVMAPYGRIDGSAAPKEKNEEYTQYFVPEFSLYPRSLMEKTKLKRVIFCDALKFAGQKRNAIPDFVNDTLYYDTVTGAGRLRYMRKVIHHEFFHIIDYRDDGALYEDNDWKALNPKEFRYGQGGARAQTVSGTGDLTDRYPGFLTHYATTGVEEDKAELFAHLIIDADYVEKRAKNEPVLRAKIEKLKRSMVAFCPQIDESFWTRAKNLKRLP